MSVTELERPNFQKPAERTLIKPKRPELRPVFITYHGPLIYHFGKLKVDDVYALAITKFFRKNFDIACKHVREACFPEIGKSTLAEMTYEIAETVTKRANNYCDLNISPPFIKAMSFDFDRK
ncbi:MAG: hypothetical protein AAF549_05995 [Pseudomonadota bacterium]